MSQEKPETNIPLVCRISHLPRRNRIIIVLGYALVGLIHAVMGALTFLIVTYDDQQLTEINQVYCTGGLLYEQKYKGDAPVEIGICDPHR